MSDYSPTLPAGSTLGKSYEYGFDVYNGTASAGLVASASDPLWLPVRRALNVVPTMTPVTQDAQSYDDKGAPNADVSAWSWTLGAAAYVNRSATTGEPVAELKVLQLRVGDTKGETAQVAVRWYHKPSDGSTADPNEAFIGIATVAYTRNNAGPEGTNEQWGLTLTGVGFATRLSANPFSGWADDTSLPVITSVLPAGRSIGGQVTITGTEFDGATAVTIDGVTVPTTTWTLIGSTTIIAEIPAGAVGASPVIVTTAAGASASVSYTVV